MFRLLPALPSAWRQGRVRGVRARGGFPVDLAWDDGRMVEATIHADRAGTVHVKAGGHAADVVFCAGESRAVQIRDGALVAQLVE